MVVLIYAAFAIPTIKYIIIHYMQFILYIRFAMLKNQLLERVHTTKTI